MKSRVKQRQNETYLVTITAKSNRTDHVANNGRVKISKNKQIQTLLVTNNSRIKYFLRQRKTESNISADKNRQNQTILV